MDDADQGPQSIVITANSDPHEARMEAREAHKYLLAKAYFDCKEFERCAAVFLPSGLPRTVISNTPVKLKKSPQKPDKGKSRDLGHDNLADKLPNMSQRSLFLALYAKYMSGEKRRDEESEMILGPSDKGSAINKELVDISRLMESYFGTDRYERDGGGWLEYLYGIVLAKGKNDADARNWLIKSLHRFPYNWGAWLELNDLIGSVEEVRYWRDRLQAEI